MGLGDRFKKIFGQGKREDDETVLEKGIDDFEPSPDESVGKDSEVVLETNPYEFELSPEGNVLFVGASNTVRSPIAEAIFNQNAAGKKAFSAGVNAQNGNPASDNVIRVCADHGIDLSGHRTRNIGNVPIYEMDLVLTATANIRDALKIIYPNLAAFTIKEYAGDTSDLDIADPFGGDLSSYGECFTEIDDAISRIIGVNVESIDEPEPAEEIIENPPEVRNFKYLDDLIREGADEIVLDSDIVLDDTEESEYPEGFKVYQELTIDGNGHVIDARNKSMFFSVYSKITLKNVALINGSGVKGIIANYTYGRVNAHDCRFEGNVSEEGGAIYNLGKINLSGCAFLKNVAKGNGGAIRCQEGSVLNVDGCEFRDNKSDKLGGVILNHGEVSFRNSDFSNNSSEDGGVISCQLGSVLNVEGCEFRDNKCDNFGGVIVNSGDVSFADSEFCNNSSKEGGVANNQRWGNIEFKGCEFKKSDAQVGGAITNWANVSLTDSNLSNNSTPSTYGWGGAIYNAENAKLKIDGVVFDKNRADLGGVVRNLGDMQVYNSIFTNNSSKEGGAIYNHTDSKCEVESSLFFKNKTYGGAGGAISNFNGELRILKTNFHDNSSRGDSFSGGGGGAIYSSRDGLMNISECIISNNFSEYGGAIENSGEAHITKCSLRKNRASKEGLAIFNGGGGLYVDDCTLCGHQSSGIGLIVNQAHLVFENSRILNNSSGGIFVNKDFLQLSNTVCSKNSSPHAVYNHENSRASIYYGQISDNLVEESVIFNNADACNINKTLFENNLSRINICNKANLTLTDPAIPDSGKSILNEGYILIKSSKDDLMDKITGDGEVEVDGRYHFKEFDFTYLDRRVHEREDDVVVLTDDICLENYELEFYEGGIELDEDGLVIDGNGVTIDGAGKSRIFIVTGRNITLKNITFKNGCSIDNYDNSLNNHGGALRINPNSGLKIIDCKFTDNTSNENGGAISIRKAELHVEDTEFDSNSAKENGIIYNEGGRIEILNSTLLENTAYKGKGIYNCAGGAVKITDSEMHGYSQEGDAVVYNDENSRLSVLNSNAHDNCCEAIRNLGQLCIHDSEFSNNMHPPILNYGRMKVALTRFENNVSKAFGAAIQNKGSMEVDDCTFLKNSSEGRSDFGGAIWSIDEMQISGSLFEDNSSGSGGAIHCGGNSQVDDCKFINNVARSYGGALYNEGRIILNGGEFEGNVSRNQAGAVFNRSLMSISDVMFADNESKHEDCENIKNDGRMIVKSISSNSPSKTLYNKHRLYTSDPSVEVYGDGDILDIGKSDETRHDFTYLNHLIMQSHRIELSEDISFDFFNDDDLIYGYGIKFDDYEMEIDGKGHTIDAKGFARIFDCKGKYLTLKNIVLKNAFGGDGSAVYCTGKLNLVNCKLVNNSGSLGGAVRAVGDLKIEGCEIKGNSGWYGGAIYVSGELQISDSELKGNNASYAGGAIRSIGGNMNVSDCVFDGNSATVGGAISKYRTELVLEGCSFEDNVPDEVYNE